MKTILHTALDYISYILILIIYVFGRMIKSPLWWVDSKPLMIYKRMTSEIAKDASVLLIALIIYFSGRLIPIWIGILLVSILVVIELVKAAIINVKQRDK